MRSNTAAQISTIAAKPILKWAGGKTQMLGELLPKVPSSYGRYIEPFFGGGALFFALQPENAVIADSNPELINMYRQVADHVDDVISYLEKYQNTSEMFYSVRSLDWETLPKAEAAARTIYLNRTCYNGLYRVNKKGQFNVPYGKYKNPKICDSEALHAASQALQKADSGAFPLVPAGTAARTVAHSRLRSLKARYCRLPCADCTMDSGGKKRTRRISCPCLLSLRRLRGPGVLFRNRCGARTHGT